MSLDQKYSAKQLFFGGLFAPLLLGLLIGGVTVAKNSFSSAGGPHIRGNKSAKVKLVEYSDFQCPYCARVEPTLRQLLKDYGNKISLEYRHYPLSFHPLAQPAAEASECAGAQGKFWEFHDTLFENQSQLSVDYLQTAAQAVGLNLTKFNACLAAGTYREKIAAELAEGQARGVKGTPGTYVNDQFINGAQDYAAFKQAIDAQL